MTHFPIAVTQDLIRGLAAGQEDPGYPLRGFRDDGGRADSGMTVEGQIP
jgi:hypothetical protein